VSDRGPGISEDKLKEVFEPFYTSKAEGMGMGLSIARTIIEAHNGVIWAKNRDHGGASFRIKLPITNDGAGPS
jgi:signal transduction histidine kinase